MQINTKYNLGDIVWIPLQEIDHRWASWNPFKWGEGGIVSIFPVRAEITDIKIIYEESQDIYPIKNVYNESWTPERFFELKRKRSQSQARISYGIHFLSTTCGHTYSENDGLKKDYKNHGYFPRITEMEENDLFASLDEIFAILNRTMGTWKEKIKVFE